MVQICCSCKTPAELYVSLLSKTPTPMDTVSCSACMLLMHARSHKWLPLHWTLWRRTPGLKEKYKTAMSADERQAIIAELELLVEQTSNKREISEKEWSQDLRVDYLDETDLKNVFKSRPDKVEKIMKNGRKMHCPITQCTWYGVPRYTFKGKKLKMQRLPQRLKAAAKAKAAAKPKVKAEGSASGKVPASS